MWSSESYFAKAHGYWLRGTNRERGSNDHKLAVALCIEFTIRGVLCSINPALNAAFDEDSLLFAVGVTPNKSPKSVDLITAFNRLHRLIPEISDEEAKAIKALVDVRNRELHSDEAAFEGMDLDAIVPSLLSFLARVIDQTGNDLEQLLTPSDAKQAREMHAAMAKDRSRGVRDLIKVQKDRFYRLPEAEQAKKREEHTPSYSSATMKTGHHIRAHKCPSCAGLGILGGAPVGRSSVLLDDDGIYQETRIVPSVFACKICNLEIKGLDELIAAKIPHEFVSRDEVDAVDHFGIDVMEYVNPEEIVREYHYEHEYMDE
ncbi:hypothetical protein [Sulfitobacter guttiformis]|uniref:Uncharacterized protein n=1 Tax=Sulfitobacter guttiformis TaxID=74349 RepID=A0A420DTX7_9RHOB|nr:hypothetical protein [Sulfitobacter guttiformis]KIN71154.1 hypothetical protein Z949_311 [Sulfitobacter guttiformis KCTC 32187]RKE97630.1 hypothetical protein C8N30_2247 [Sulfitobacter guttiformis]